MNVLVEGTETFSSKWPVNTLFQPSSLAWMVQFSEGNWCFCRINGVCVHFSSELQNVSVIFQNFQIAQEDISTALKPKTALRPKTASQRWRKSAFCAQRGFEWFGGVCQWRMRDEKVGRVFRKICFKFVFTYLRRDDLFYKQRK